MADLTIRGLPDELFVWLKRQAQANHRSLNKETIALLERVQSGAVSERPRLSASEILALGQRFASLPVLDGRSTDEIMGYDDQGLPG